MSLSRTQFWITNEKQNQILILVTKRLTLGWIETTGAAAVAKLTAAIGTYPHEVSDKSYFR